MTATTKTPGTRAELTKLRGALAPNDDSPAAPASSPARSPAAGEPSPSDDDVRVCRRSGCTNVMRRCDFRPARWVKKAFCSRRCQQRHPKHAGSPSTLNVLGEAEAVRRWELWDQLSEMAGGATDAIDRTGISDRQGGLYTKRHRAVTDKMLTRIEQALSGLGPQDGVDDDGLRGAKASGLGPDGRDGINGRVVFLRGLRSLLARSERCRSAVSLGDIWWRIAKATASHAMPSTVCRRLGVTREDWETWCDDASIMDPNHRDPIRAMALEVIAELTADAPAQDIGGAVWRQKCHEDEASLAL